MSNYVNSFEFIGVAIIL